MVIRESETKTTSSSTRKQVDIPQNGDILTVDDVLALEAT